MITYKCRGGFAPMSFSDLAPLLGEHPRFIILDRDGTLVPYSPTPELAFLPPMTRGVLCDLVDQNQGLVAIISARGLNSLQKEFDPGKQILAGNYGLEISFPSGQTFLHPGAAQAKPHIRALAEEMTGLLSQYPQLILDDHVYSLCLHYHLLPPHKQNHVAAQVSEFKTRYPALRFHDLPTSFEVVPPLDWNKGQAIEEIIRELGLPTNDFLYLTVGDTEADEPMYNWVNTHGGMSFNVGHRDESQALGRFDSSDDVVAFLRGMLDLRNHPESGLSSLN